MAGTYCINCGKKSSEPFKFCPDCGHEFGRSIGSGIQKESTSPSNPTLRLGTKIWLLTFIFFLALIFGMLSASGGKGPQREKIEDEQDAHYYGTVFIRRQLKAPKTAEFGSYRDCTTILTDPGKRWWTSTCYVDSQNGFGALLRSSYWITLRYEKTTDTWYQIDSEIK